MLQNYLTSKKAPLTLFLAAMLASFSFTACSSNSKKEQKGNNQAVTNTTSQQPTATEQQETPEATTSKNQSTEAKTNKATEETKNVEQTETETSSSSSAKSITAASGHKIIENNGCLACHSTNGKKMAGPSFKNLYGRKTTLKNGKTITANAAYLTESIKDPSAKVVKGFAPVMPRFSYLKDDQIASIIAYFKSISE